MESKEVVSGTIFGFTKAERSIGKVRYFVDAPKAALEHPKVAGTPLITEGAAPYDLAGTAADGTAKPFDTTKLANGKHMLTTAVDNADGTTDVVNTPFIVYNGPPKLLFGTDPLKFDLPEGGRASKTIDILTSDNKIASYQLSESAPWLRIEKPVLDSGKYSAPAVRTLAVDTTGLDPGTYTTQITTSADGYTSDSQTVTMQVEAASTCSPVPCEEILVDLPYRLDFNQDHGKILDKNNVGTGFTYLDQPTNGTGYMPQNLTMNTAAPGTLDVTTTNGIMFGASNAQDNALAVGIDAPNQITSIDTTLLNPPAGSGKFEQGGLWFGNDEDNYVKLELISTPSGTMVEYLKEVNGSTVASKSSGVLNLSSSKVHLRLKTNPYEQNITAYYQVDGGAMILLQTFVAPPEFFSFDAAGIDPTIGTRSFGGIFTSHRNSTTPLTYTFDDFSVEAAASPAPPPSDLSFERSLVERVSNPTSMAWGPDDRLYVSELFGRIHALTLNENKEATSNQVITTLGSRMTLGITVDPQSTPNNVILWVAHSDPSVNNGQLNSGTISRLSGPNFANREDVITGLPRAIANHGINSLHFGPDGRLYIAAGGNTGAGAPNEANTEFGTRAEQPLSAALLVADVRAAGFDGSCATPENTYGPSPCDVQVYSSGLRNMYDFVIHSNGSIYGPDNGLGVTGTYPPSPTPPCEGFANTTSWTQGGHNPGEQPDILLRLEQGKYYGHPNPYRNECVFKNGSYQSVAPLPNYVPPIHTLGNHTSSNGAIEYKSTSFNGALKGELLIANYSVGDDITRIKLSADGTSVVEAKQLAGGFTDPLPLVEGPDGTIYVGEMGNGQITALRPANPGSWTTKAPAPEAVLDAGGTAVGDKLYMVAGKTTAGPQSDMYVYDPATNSWTSGPPLPGPAVENPAVADYNGKLYAFGGSTGPFSGAVSNAAVYDPATNNWTALAPMPTARGGATAREIGGKIYVVGGMDGTGASLATVEVYDPATDTWSTAPAMATRRDNPGSAVVNGKLYIFGGRIREASGIETNPTLASSEVFNPATNQWAAIAPMPTGRRTMVVGTLRGRVQVISGERTSTGGTFPQNEEYNPATNTWINLASMPTPRHGAAAGTINGVIYAAGGGPLGGSSFSTVHEAFSFGNPSPPADTTAPTVANVAPQDGAGNVPVSANVEATFSEAMDAQTINGTTFTLTEQGSGTVNAAVSYNAELRMATLNPIADLDAGASYTATIKGGTGGVEDESGNALATDKVWSFTTAAPVDTTAPETTIDDGPSDTVNSASATFTFSSNEQNSTFECSLDGAAFSACNPDNTLNSKTYSGLSNGQHTFEVRATDAANNTDATPASRAWTIDTTAPTVGNNVSPQDGAIDVPVAASVSATFSEDMRAASIDTTTFTLTKQGSGTVNAAVSYNAELRMATLNPIADLDAGASYTATIKGGTGGVEDESGNALATDKVWSFTTSTSTYAAGLKGQYDDDAAYIGGRDFDVFYTTRSDATVNFNWGTGAPVSGMGPNDFAVRWTGEVYVPTSGKTVFYISSNDGHRIYVDGVRRKDTWREGNFTGSNEKSAPVDLTAGWHTIQLEMFDATGDASARLSYDPAGTTEVKQVIPSARLRHIN